MTYKIAGIESWIQSRENRACRSALSRVGWKRENREARIDCRVTRSGEERE